MPLKTEIFSRKTINNQDRTVVSYFIPPYIIGPGASLVAQMVKCLPAIQETQVQFLGQEHPLEKEMATHSSTLA